MTEEQSINFVDKEWLSSNFVKMAMAILICGVCLGFAGNKIITYFVMSDTTAQFDKIAMQLDNLNQTVQQRLDNDEKKLGQIDDMNVKLAVISAQLAILTNQVNQSSNKPNNNTNNGG